jgi:hypothetical protein
MTQLVYPGIGKKQEEGKELINKKRRVAGRKKRLETFCPPTYIKLK